MCVSLWTCACAPITTKSAENKISLTDIKETHEGKMICFQSWWATFLSPTSTAVIFHSNPPSSRLCCHTTTGWHMWRSVSTASHANQTSRPVWCADQLFIWGFSRLGISALTHCFPPQSADLCLQSEVMREQSKGRFGNTLNHQREWWGVSEREERAQTEARPWRRWMKMRKSELKCYILWKVEKYMRWKENFVSTVK